jgi:regulator of sigma E protease
MEFIQNFGYFIVFIGSLVFFHELGHFLVAKFFDVKVLSFSIGFGPELFSFRRGETTWWVNYPAWRCRPKIYHGH